MLFGVLFAHKRYAWRKYAYVLLIVTGMAIFLYKPGKGQGFQLGAGELLLAASLAMDGVTGAVQGNYFVFKEKYNFNCVLQIEFAIITAPINGL